MICRLCLDDVHLCFNFFESQGLALNASDVVAKYFWFKPLNGDSISEIICYSCWDIIESFHKLYEKVEQNQNKFLKTIKNDPTDELLIPIDVKTEPSKFEEVFDVDIFLDKSNFCSNAKKEDKLHNIPDNNDNNIKTENDDIVLDKNDGQTRLKRKIKIREPQQRKTRRIEIRSDEESAGSQNENQNEENDVIPLDELSLEKDKNQLSDVEKNAKRLKMAEENIMIQQYINLSCPICSEPLKTFSNLSHHFSKNHKQQKSYLMCCGTKFFKRNRLVDHIEKHMNPESFICDLCGKKLANRWSLRSHMKIKHLYPKSKRYPCSRCGKIFCTASALLRHEGTHLPKSERQFKCDLCDKTYALKINLTNHVKYSHLEAKDHYAGVCDICGKKYRQKADLVNHRLAHDGIKQPKVQCDICKSWYKDKYKLKSHIAGQHPVEPECHKCPHCDKTSTTQHALRSHIRYTHLMEKKFECNLCQKAFKKPLELKEHLAWHTGTALYQCPHCPKTFSHNSNLHHHRKQVHRKEFEAIRAKHGRNFNLKEVTEIKNDNTFSLN